MEDWTEKHKQAMFKLLNSKFYFHKDGSTTFRDKPDSCIAKNDRIEENTPSKTEGQVQYETAKNTGSI